MTNTNQQDIDALLNRLLGDKAKDASDASTAFKDGVQEVKDAFSQALDEVAADHDVTREAILAEIAVGLWVSVMLGRNVRRGNVTKTLYWIFAAQNINANHRARRLRTLLKKQSNA